MPINPLKDFLLKSPLSAMMSLESRLPLPRVSSLLLSLADALPDFGPKPETRSVDEVLPELAAPRPTEVPPPLGKIPAPPPEQVVEKAKGAREFFFE